MTRRLVPSDLPAAAIATMGTVGFTLLGGTLALGAHPWWATRVGLVGAVIGLAAWLALRLLGAGCRAVIGLASATVLLGAASVWIGKARFAASFAEDALAGRAWFFGWIVLMAGGFVLIAGLAGLFRRAPR